MYFRGLLFFAQWPGDAGHRIAAIALVFKWPPNVLDNLSVSKLKEWGDIADKMLEKGVI